MISYMEGDITRVSSGIIVHGVNCQGMMGSGVAKAVQAKWPQVYDSYCSHIGGYLDGRHTRSELLGRIDVVEIDPFLTIVNAFTQLNYGKDGKRYVSYDAVARCFEAIAFVAKEKDKWIYIPQIGAGLGGGNWSVISRIIDAACPDITVTCVLQDISLKPRTVQALHQTTGNQT